MTMQVSSALLGQFEAALRTLHQAVTDCPQPEWSGPHPDSPFSQVVFHALLFTDIYLGWGEEAVKDQDFHVLHRSVFLDYEELADRPAVMTYGRDFILDYLAFVLAKARSSLPKESDGVLLGASGFSYRPFPRLELHLYSIRHIQHHAAQLGLRNQLLTGKSLAWASSGWPQP